jgi:uncharacterized protein
MSTLRCPNCGRRFLATLDHFYRPFCSERCRLVDLGAWMNESRRIPGGTAAVEPAQEDTDIPRTITH